MLIVHYRGNEVYYPFHTIFKVRFEEDGAEIFLIEVTYTLLVNDRTDVENLRGWLIRGGQFTITISAE